MTASCGNSLMEAVIAGRIIDHGESSTMANRRISRFSATLTADKQKKSASLMRLYEIGTRKIRTYACPSFPPFARSSSPVLVSAFNRMVTRHDCFVFNFPAFNTALAIVRGTSRRSSSSNNNNNNSSSSSNNGAATG